MFVSCINTAVSAHLILECEATMFSTPGGNNSAVQRVAGGMTGLPYKIKYERVGKWNHATCYLQITNSDGEDLRRVKHDLQIRFL